MNTVRLAALVLAAGLIAGCVTISTPVPTGWDEPMRRPASGIAGTYRNTGEMTLERPGHPLGAASLDSVLNAVTADPSFCPSSDAIRLRPIGHDTLEITPVNGTAVGPAKTLAADIGAETSITGVKVERTINRKNSKISNLKTHEDAVLLRGSDGFLYVQLKHCATAVLAGVVPFGGNEETWLRFPPAP